MLIQRIANDTLAWVWMSQHGFSQRKSIIGGWHFSAWMATPYSRKVLFWAFCKRRRQKHALFGLIMYSTVCFFNGWPQTKCKVTFYTCLWPSFSGSFTWGPWFCSPCSSLLFCSSLNHFLIGRILPTANQNLWNKRLLELPWRRKCLLPCERA